MALFVSYWLRGHGQDESSFENFVFPGRAAPRDVGDIGKLAKDLERAARDRHRSVQKCTLIYWKEVEE